MQVILNKSILLLFLACKIFDDDMFLFIFLVATKSKCIHFLRTFHTWRNSQSNNVICSSQTIYEIGFICYGQGVLEKSNVLPRESTCFNQRSS